MRHLRGPVLRVLAAVLSASSLICAAQSAKNSKPTVLKQASSGATTTDAKLAVAQHYTKDMASQANLDAQKPQLSTDGFLSQGGDKPLASSECLLAQTILASQGSKPGLSVSQIDSLCTSLTLASKNTPMNYQMVLGATTKGPTIDYALIHIVRWDAPQSAAGLPTSAGNWYLFDRGNNRASGSIVPWKNVGGVSPITTTTHLLGSRNVAFLAIQLGIDDTCGISYDLTSTHTKPLNQQDVSNLIQTAISVFGANSKTTTPAKSTTAAAKAPAPAPASTKWVGVWGGEVMVKQDDLPANLAMTPSMTGTVRAFSKGDTKATDIDDSIVATCSPTPKAQAPQLPGKASVNGLGLPDDPRSRSRGSLFQLASYPRISRSGEQVQNTSSSSSSTANPSAKANSGNGAGGSATGKDPLSGLSQTISNEPTHHWDVSIAMPVTSYNSLKYDSTNNLLVPKTTSSLNPYALFDIYPIGVDLASYNGSGIAISMPKFTTGIPIGNQPLQKPFVGTGFVGTIKSFRFQPIVGLHIQREVRADSPTSKLTHTEWHAKLQVMIGFSITDARKVLGIK